MSLAKGSLFLGRMTQLSDGISFLLGKQWRREVKLAIELNRDTFEIEVLASKELFLIDF